MPFNRECTSCGAVFQTENPRKVKCKKDCRRARSVKESHAARTRKQEANDLEFIAVDGEGVKRDDWYEDWDDELEEFVTRKRTVTDYILLSVGEEALHRNGAALTHVEIFEFLWEQFQEHQNAVFVGFFLGYDFAQWFKSMPANVGWSLLAKDGIARRQPRADSPQIFPWPVRYGGWEFDILGMKRFKLRPHIPWEQRPEKIVNHKDGTMSVVKYHPHSWMYICDSGSFFQTSLMTVINPKNWATPIVSDEEYAILERGKLDRDTAQFSPEMIEYNRIENVVLARIMADLNAGFVSDGIRLKKKQWFGPGQAAQEWMKLIGVPTGEEVREVVPRWARDAARESYYGGWFEIRGHGYIPGTTYGYDINSAYPHIIASLPCLLHGVWTTGVGKPPPLAHGSMRLVDATVEGDKRKLPPFGPAPHRTATGTILRPLKTTGWYWWHEMQASKRAGFLHKMTVHNWVDYKPCKCAPPLAAISEMYEGRLRVGKNTSSGKAKKLVYNSAYGKMAQSVGQPRFSNPIYASLITAGCRTMILDAIATHPGKGKAVVMVATDAVYFDSPHPTLDLDEERLGAWGEEPHENITLLMPGLYWDESSRERFAAGKDVKLKSRGIAGRDLAAFMTTIDSEFQKKKDMRMWDYWPKFEIPVQFGMVGAKLAASQDRWHDCGVINTTPRKMDSQPYSKRAGEVLGEGRYIYSVPYAEAAENRSVPYERAFGEDVAADEAQELRALLTPDGSLESDLAQIVPHNLT